VGLPERSKGFLKPTLIKGFSGAVAIVGSFQHRCALESSGKVRCFGSGTGGRLGTSAAKSSTSAIEVPGLPRIVRIAAGDHCTFALGEDHSLWAWGESWIGACGLPGDSADVTKAPVTVPLLEGSP
jgi:alpha-tubulin suppressor-like RCC1 family protein